MNAVETMDGTIPVDAACDALGVSRASMYRATAPKTPPMPPELRAPRPPPPRKLTEPERQAVIDVVHDAEFVDQPPAEIVYTLLSRGIYLASVRTFYRVLESLGESRERRHQRVLTHHAAPRLTATAPNQVWTWDITKLAGPEPGVFFMLYMMIDLFSRYIVGWMVAEHENADLATRFIDETVKAHGVDATKLTVHNDRGSPMTAQTTMNWLASLGVTHSFSRPRVSNDNAFSEAQFKTLKYQPDYPTRFGSAPHARAWVGEFVPWFCFEHHHEGLAYFTPADVFFGRVAAVAARRQAALDAAYAAHPERFVHGPPRVALPPASVSINPIVPTIPSLESPPEASLRPSSTGTVSERAQDGSRAAKPASEASEPLMRPSTIADSTVRRAEVSTVRGIQTLNS